MINSKLKTKNLKPQLKIKISNIKVLIGMSGGVDSSVAACLLKKQGYDVIGVFLKFWHQPESRICTDLIQTYAEKNCHADQNSLENKPNKNICEKENKCCDYASLLAARSVAEKLKIPFYVLNCSKEFKKEIVDYFTSEYDSGRTPNPCIECNKKIKFGWMMEQAKKLGCDYVATGHYSRIARETPNNKIQITKINEIQNNNLDNKCHSELARLDSKINSRQVSESRSRNKFGMTELKYKLLTAKDKKKDQSYFLWQLDQNQLSQIIFPLGKYTKDQVRNLAKEWELPVAEKKDSQDICFVSNISEFLSNYANKLTKSGDIVDLEGNVLGKHRGLCYYTVGQREGLGVQIKNSNGSHPEAQLKDLEILRYAQNDNKLINQQINKAGFQPAYVVKLNTNKNQLVVGSKDDLNSCELTAEKVNWAGSYNTQHVICSKKFVCEAKIRYGAAKEKCQIEVLDNEKVKVIFTSPVRAVTPGQSIVFYKKDELVGGGVITM